jgi:hypothetical protein
MENLNDRGSEIGQTNPEKNDGEVASASNAFLWAALGSVAASLSLKILKRNPALAIGIGVPAFLLFGIYKMSRQTAKNK